MIFHVTMEPVEDGWIMVECPALPGCISQGKDEQEALANIKEAIAAEESAGPPPLRSMIEDVYAEVPSRLAEQLAQIESLPRQKTGGVHA